MSEKAKTVTNKKRKTRLPNNEISLCIYLLRVLGQVSPGTGITRVALVQLNSIINHIGKAINLASVRLLEINGKKTVTSRDIQSAVRMVLPGELLKHAVSESTKAITLYNSSKSLEPKDDKKKPKICANVRAHLQFSVSKVRKFFTHERIGSGSPIYLAATLEYLAAEVLELSATLVRNSKKVRITTRHIFLAIHQDEELKKLANRTGVLIASGGVVPTLEKAERRYRKNAETGKMIAIAGTRAMQDIVAQQSTYGKVVFAKAPFERMIRIFAEDRGASGMSSDAVLALQVAVEEKTLEIFQSALEISKISKRQKVTPADFNTALRIMKIETVDFIGALLKDKEFVVKAAIKRLAHKAGIKLLSGTIYPEVHKFIYGFTGLIVEEAVFPMQNCRRKRMSLTDVLFALETFGIKLAFAPKKKKVVKAE
jgi:histone H2B